MPAPRGLCHGGCGESFLSDFHTQGNKSIVSLVLMLGGTISAFVIRALTQTAFRIFGRNLSMMMLDRCTFRI